MKKTIIALYGRSGEGKSETIKNVCRIMASYPNAVPSYQPIDYSGDILITIQIGSVRIGFESQGDPNSRMITDDTIRQLADRKSKNAGYAEHGDLGDCDIIICASRTRSGTVQKVDEIADDYGYHTLWRSSYYAPNFDHTVVNRMAAQEIESIIKVLISGQL